MEYDNLNRQKENVSNVSLNSFTSRVVLLSGTFDCVFLVLANHESSQYFTPVLATAIDTVRQRHGHQIDKPPRYR